MSERIFATSILLVLRYKFWLMTKLYHILITGLKYILSLVDQYLTSQGVTSQESLQMSLQYMILSYDHLAGLFISQYESSGEPFLPVSLSQKDFHVTQ